MPLNLGLQLVDRFALRGRAQTEDRELARRIRLNSVGTAPIAESRYFGDASRSQGRLPSVPLSQGRAVEASFSSAAARARSAWTRSRSVGGAFVGTGSLCAHAGAMVSNKIKMNFLIPRL